MFKWLRNGPYNMEIMLETIPMHVGIIKPFLVKIGYFDARRVG